MQFYRSRVPPSVLLVSHKVTNADLVLAALKNHNKTIKLEVPTKGERLNRFIMLLRTHLRN